MISHINYIRLNKRSINYFPILKCPEDVINMKCDETRGFRTEQGFILVEKYEGTSLKNAIKNGQLHNPPPGFKIIIINELYEPMFINNDKYIYFCDNLKKKMYTKKKEAILLYGPYDSIIMETIKTFNDGLYKRMEYYVIVSMGSNKFDGTNDFVASKDLTDGNEIQIREIQKKIIRSIMNKYYDNRQEYGLNMYVVLVLLMFIATLILAIYLLNFLRFYVNIMFRFS